VRRRVRRPVQGRGPGHQALQRLSTSTTATWTFKSATVPGDEPKALPISAVRFKPKLDAHNTAPAAGLFPIAFQVEHQPGSTAGTTRTLDVQVSFDDGATWSKASVLRIGDTGLAFVRHPGGHGFVSLKTKAADGAGNTVEETIIRAYRT
jgi:hypothetical protein